MFDFYEWLRNNGTFLAGDIQFDELSAMKAWSRSAGGNYVGCSADFVNPAWMLSSGLIVDYDGDKDNCITVFLASNPAVIYLSCDFAGFMRKYAVMNADIFSAELSVNRFHALAYGLQTEINKLLTEYMRTPAFFTRLMASDAVTSAAGDWEVMSDPDTALEVADCGVGALVDDDFFVSAYRGVVAAIDKGASCGRC